MATRTQHVCCPTCAPSYDTRTAHPAACGGGALNLHLLPHLQLVGVGEVGRHHSVCHQLRLWNMQRGRRKERRHSLLAARRPPHVAELATRPALATRDDEADEDEGLGGREGEDEDEVADGEDDDDDGEDQEDDEDHNEEDQEPTTKRGPRGAGSEGGTMGGRRRSAGGGGVAGGLRPLLANPSGVAARQCRTSTGPLVATAKRHGAARLQR